MSGAAFGPGSNCLIKRFVPPQGPVSMWNFSRFWIARSAALLG